MPLTYARPVRLGLLALVDEVKARTCFFILRERQGLLRPFHLGEHALVIDGQACALRADFILCQSRPAACKSEAEEWGEWMFHILVCCALFEEFLHGGDDLLRVA